MGVYKVVDVEQLDADLTSLADSIRSKTGTTGEMAFPGEFKSAVDGINNGEILEDAEDLTINLNIEKNYCLQSGEIYSTTGTEAGITPWGTKFSATETFNISGLRLFPPDAGWNNVEFILWDASTQTEVFKITVSADKNVGQWLEFTIPAVTLESDKSYRLVADTADGSSFKLVYFNSGYVFSRIKSSGYNQCYATSYGEYPSYIGNGQNQCLAFDFCIGGDDSTDDTNETYAIKYTTLEQAVQEIGRITGHTDMLTVTEAFTLLQTIPTMT